MKKILYCLLAIFAEHTFAQQFAVEELLNKNKPYQELLVDARQYFKCIEEDSIAQLMSKDDKEYTYFKRWKSINQHRMMPNGYIAGPSLDNDALDKINRVRSNGNWVPVGQSNISQTPDGIGRVDAVGFHPNDSLILYLGTWAGGIFKSIDGGQHWFSIGDDLPYASVGSICVDAVDPDIIFITVGKGIINGSGIGIYKSVDAGATWLPTSQVSTVAAAITYHKLIKHPVNNAVMYSCQSNGLFRTINGGVTWTSVNNLDITDLHFNPLNPQTIYTVGSGFNGTPAQVYKSTNGGTSFSQISNLPAGLFVKIGLTRADTNYIGLRYIVGANVKFLLSTNGGSTFNIQNAALSIDNGAGTPVLSQLNKNRLYDGFPTLFKSNNAGINFTTAYTNMHADTRGIFLSPYNLRYIYFCTDGGLYKLDDSTGTVLSLSEGLNITHFYNIAVSEQDTVTLLGGSLDNGSRFKNINSHWSHVTGGDGFACAIHPNDSNIMYTSSQDGVLYNTTNSWNNYNVITPFGQTGTSGTQLKLNPQNANTLYTVFHDVYKATNNGSVWIPLSNFTSFSSNSKLNFIAIAPQDSNTIFAGSTYIDKYFYTHNEGTTWNTFTPPVVLGGSYQSAIAIHPQNSSKVIITKDGYFNGDKVYVSTDNGITWSNISYDLPNVPVLSIVLDNYNDTTNITYYIGTTIGVFSKNEIDSSWNYFGTGLPRTNINELVIRQLDRKLIAATGGRGAYEIKLPSGNTPTNVSNNDVDVPAFIINNPAINRIHISNIHPQFKTINIFDLSGKLVLNQSINNSGFTKIQIDCSSLSEGMYFISLSGNTQKQTKKLIIKQ